MLGSSPPSAAPSSSLHVTSKPSAVMPRLLANYVLASPAANGTAAVQMADAATVASSVRFPPSVSAIVPPTSCVAVYPIRNADYICPYAGVVGKRVVSLWVAIRYTQWKAVPASEQSLGLFCGLNTG